MDKITVLRPNQVFESPIAWVSLLVGSVAGYSLFTSMRKRVFTKLLWLFGLPVALAGGAAIYSTVFATDPGMNWFKLMTLPLLLSYPFVLLPLTVGWMLAGLIWGGAELVKFGQRKG